MKLKSIVACILAVLTIISSIITDIICKPGIAYLILHVCVYTIILMIIFFINELSIISKELDKWEETNY